MEKQKMNVRRESKISIVEPRGQKITYTEAIFSDKVPKLSQFGEQMNWKDVINANTNLRGNGISNGRITSLKVKAPKNGIAGLL